MPKHRDISSPAPAPAVIAAAAHLAAAGGPRGMSYLPHTPAAATPALPLASVMSPRPDTDTGLRGASPVAGAALHTPRGRRHADLGLLISPAPLPRRDDPPPNPCRGASASGSGSASSLGTVGHDADPPAPPPPDTAPRATATATDLLPPPPPLPEELVTPTHAPAAAPAAAAPPVAPMCTHLQGPPAPVAPAAPRGREAVRQGLRSGSAAARARSGSAAVRREVVPAAAHPHDARMSRALRMLRSLPDTEYRRMTGPTHPPPEALPMLRPLLLLLGVVRQDTDHSELYSPRSRVWASAWRAFRKLPRSQVEEKLSATKGDVLLSERVTRCLLKEMDCDAARLTSLSRAALHLHEWCAALLASCPTRGGGDVADRELAESKASHIIRKRGEQVLPAPAGGGGAAKGVGGGGRRVVHSVQEWLDVLMLPQYAEVFREAEVRDLPTVALLTDQDFVEMKIPIGPKRKLLTAVAHLRGTAA